MYIIISIATYILYLHCGREKNIEKSGFHLEMEECFLLPHEFNALHGILNTIYSTYSIYVRTKVMPCDMHNFIFYPLIVFSQYIHEEIKRKLLVYSSRTQGCGQSSNNILEHIHNLSCHLKLPSESINYRVVRNSVL